jgi:hypothetical protein
MFERERLPDRDGLGFTFHPDLPPAEEGEEQGAIEALGYEAQSVPMEFDGSDEVNDLYTSGDASAARGWDPTPPEGEGWLLVAIGDTEDGPCAWFVRRRRD